MRVLFCHDGPLREDEEGNFYGIAHNNEMFERYRIISDEIAVVIRTKDIAKEEADNRLSEITIPNFEVISCPNFSTVKGQFHNKFLAKKIISQEVLKSDYVIARLPSFIGNIAIDMAKKYHKPYLIESVACPWDAFWNYSKLGKVIAPYMFIATRRRIKHAGYVIYVTTRFLQNRYPTKGINISCSNVSLPVFDKAILTKRLDNIDKPKKKIVLGTTAAVDVKFKGQRIIIEALSKLKDLGYNNFEYQLIGGGNQNYLSNIADKYNVTDSVKFLGAVPKEKVFEWLDKVDIYCQPSKQEGLPRALIEAMSRATPCFGASVAGIPELIEEDFLFKHNKEAIEKICSILIKLTDKKIQKEQAILNFNQSINFEKNLLDKKRNEFYLKFKQTSKENI